MTNHINTKDIIHDIVDAWNDKHNEEWIYEANMTDDSVCVYSDGNIELNLEPIEHGLSATIYNLKTYSIDDYVEFTYGINTTAKAWVNQIIDYMNYMNNQQKR